MPSLLGTVARTGWIVIIAATLLAPLPAADAPAPEDPPWRWPVAAPREVLEPFRAPAHDYGPGHRGIDIAAPPGSTAVAPSDGVVAFRGVVVDRPLITVDHGSGYVTTFEPLDSDLAVGTPVKAGDELGTVAVGGHTATGALHIGVRLDGTYINPMLMFGEVPRAVLLPCCDALTREDAPDGRSP
jgi:murein DD-endopeptidase MepM/ murein hydrolase activator NlpD